MGKQRIAELLNQLETDRQKDLKNSAAIYAVAQVAVNRLASQLPPEQLPSALLPPAPSNWDKTKLLQLYGSYNGCRKAAKDLGIKFATSPSWLQLAQAFSYAEALQHLAHRYLETYPAPNLKQVTIGLRLSN
ncbi:hypothetical protein [Altericista sp. CCNU0014]|uniref:hypothetical protein n=1 Tax=Altericista sp. CCNU0014 TaxID=3082949 RepID=UPI00384A8FA3